MASQDLGTRFYTLYHDLTGKDVCIGCGGAISEALRELRTLLVVHLNPKKPMTKSTCQFTLKGDRQIHVKSVGVILTKDNLTDSLCLAALRQNPKLISLFDSFPDDWKAQSTAKPKPAPAAKPAAKAPAPKPAASNSLVKPKAAAPKPAATPPAKANEPVKPAETSKPAEETPAASN